MIIVRLSGGLGNQMFQYAMGRSLCHRLQSTLKLDISLFKHNPHRSYALRDFNILEDFASAEEVYRFSGVPQNISQKIAHRLNKPLLFARRIFPWTLNDSNQRSSHAQPRVYAEPHFHYDPEVINLRGHLYLKGYWQTEKYFKDIEHIIRKEFTVKNPLAGRNLAYARQIQDCESVSVHVRRGDYLTHARWRRTHGVCPVAYFEAAIEQMKEQVTGSHFFIFSDDPRWVANNMHVDGPATMVNHNGPEAAHEDLRLMSLCRNHILANSTFSWWGAWLKSSRSGIVIAPQQWFGEERMQTRRLDDLFLSDWYIL
jgi:hypothetical protein